VIFVIKKIGIIDSPCEFKPLDLPGVSLIKDVTKTKAWTTAY